MAQLKFLVLIDENMANGVVEGLEKRSVEVRRVIDVVPAGTKDDPLLEFAYQHGYTLITHDENIKRHVEKRVDAAKEHCGVFIAPNKLQGPDGIGRIVDFIAEYDAFIKGGAASLENDVYNKITYIPG